MENEVKLYHRHLFRLDDTLNTKLLNHMESNDMSMAGLIRTSLRQYFQNEELKTNVPTEKAK
jgi:hypothetical protein